MLHHDPQAIRSGDFLWWAVQDLHTVRPAVLVVVPPSSAGKRAIKKQFCRSRTARFAIRGKSALAELGCTTCSLQTVLREFLSCFSLIFRAFPAFCFSVIRCADHKKRPFSFSDRLMKRTIYYPKQLLWFIVLHFCINVHSCFAVFVSGKVLYCLWINARIEKIGDVSVP